MVKKISWKLGSKFKNIMKNNYTKEPLDQIKETYLHFMADYYLISFPKCGRTWIRLMIGKFFQEYYELKNIPKDDILRLTPLSKYNPKIPLIRLTHDDNPHLKTPEELKTTKNKYRNKKVIFLIRDPRDVIVSLYHHFLKRTKRIEDNYEIKQFIRRKNGGLESIITFYNIWYENRHIPKEFITIKYENFHRELYKEGQYVELIKTLSFIGFNNFDHELLSLITDYASFKNMRKMEKKDSFKDTKILKTSNKEDVESYKTRKGKIGGYQDYLEKEDINYIDKTIEEKLNKSYKY
jgi:hypothetical protein